MQNFVVVNEVESLQQLAHDLFDFGQAELDVHVVQQTGQIVIAEFEHQIERGAILVCILLRTTDLQQTDHVLMLKQLQYFDFAQCGDRKALFFVLHKYLLQSDDLSGAFVPGLEHFAKCAFRVRTWLAEEQFCCKRPK